ncbi:MAG: hypothetical protein ABDH28_05345 [Brevinematia bacterium]
MKKLCLIVIGLILTLQSFSFNSYRFLDIFTPSSEGFFSGFSPFNTYPFGVFHSPQSLDSSSSYSLGFSVNNTVGGSILSAVGHFKVFTYPMFLGVAHQFSSLEMYDNTFKLIGNCNQNFLVLGAGTKFDKVFSVDFGDVDFGASLMFSFDNWVFPQGVYDRESYYLEAFFIPLVGAKLSTYYGLELSLSQALFVGGYFGDFAFGGDTKLSLRYSPISLFSNDKSVQKYLVVYPFVSFGFVRVFPTNDKFVNEVANFRGGVGVVSEPFEGMKISLGIDNKGISVSFVFSLLSSPVGVGSASYEGMRYNHIPSLFLIFSERVVKQVLGITPDKEEVEKGIVEYEKGNFTNANYHFERALKHNPSNQVAQIYIQKLRLWLEKDEALTKEQQEYVKTLLTRAKVMRSQNKYGEAIKEYKKVLELNPYNKEALDSIKEIESIVSEEINRNYKEALVLYSRNELLEAKKLITRNIELNPFHEPSTRLAKEVDDRIQTEMSKKFEVEQRKSLSYSLYSQGMQEFSSYNFLKALELFNKALEVYPGNKEAEEAVKKTLKEIEISSKIQENRSKSELLVAEGKKLKGEGKYWEAIDKFREALRFYRDNEIAKSEISNTILTVRSQANVLEREGDEFFVSGEIGRAFEKWESALVLLKDLPEAVSLRQKIDSRKEELKSSISIKIANAEDFLNAGDYISAMKTLEGILKLDPTNIQANSLHSKARKKFDEYVDGRFNDGVRMFNAKDYSRAVVVFEELLGILPVSDTRYAKSKSYYEESKKVVKELETRRMIEERMKEVDAFLVNYDYESAKKVLEAIMKLDPNNSEVRKKIEEIDRKAKEVTLRDEANKLLGEGLRKIRKKEYADGISSLKKAKEKFILLGDDVSLIDSYIKSAEEEFALEKDKSFKDGKLAYERGEYIKAKEYLEIALKNNPDSQEIKLLLSEVRNKLKVLEKEMLDKSDKFYSSGEYDKALEGYNSLLKISPNNELYKLKIDNIHKIREGMNEVSNLIKVGKYSEALDIVDELVGLNPSDSNLKILRDGVLEKFYGFLSSAKMEVDELIKKGNYRKAIIILEGVLKSDPNDVEAKSKLSLARKSLEEKVLRNLSAGRSAYNAGNYKEAIRLLSLVLEDDPNNTFARTLRDEARAKYNEAISKDREKIQRDVASFMSKGVEEYRKGNVDKAIEYWQKVLDIDPDNDQAKKYIARAKLGK